MAAEPLTARHVNDRLSDRTVQLSRNRPRMQSTGLSYLALARQLVSVQSGGPYPTPPVPLTPGHPARRVLSIPPWQVEIWRRIERHLHGWRKAVAVVR